VSLEQAISRELLNEREAAEFLRMSVATIRRYRYGIGGRTDGPRVIKIGGAVRYARSDLNKFINANALGTHVPKRARQKDDR
jgi:predicted DNA-binding transcriptional regulator AlpA